MGSLVMPSNCIWRPIVVLVAFAFGHYLVGGLLLQYNRFVIDIVQARKSEPDPSAGKANIAIHPAEEARQLAISLEKYALEIQKRRSPWKAS